MLIQRLIFALISLGILWIVSVIAGLIFAVFAPVNAIRKILAVTDNWLLRPLYNLIGWIAEAKRFPNRDG